MEQSLKVRLKSAAPFLMNNGHLANPMNAFAKEMKKITGKRAKTEADFEAIAQIEWRGSLYASEGKPCIPGFMLEACFINGAKKIKKGMQAKAGMYCAHDFPLHYEGPSGIDDLWQDEDFRFVANCRPQGRATVIRTRPIFQKWACDVEFVYNDEMLSHSDILEILKIAGRDVGIGNWRPKYGRFVVEDMA